MPIMHYTCNASFLLVITRIIPLHGIVCCTSSDCQQSARRCLSLSGLSTCLLCPGRKWRYPSSRRLRVPRSLLLWRAARSLLLWRAGQRRSLTALRYTLPGGARGRQTADGAPTLSRHYRAARWERTLRRRTRRVLARTWHPRGHNTRSGHNT